MVSTKTAQMHWMRRPFFFVQRCKDKVQILLGIQAAGTMDIWRGPAVRGELDIGVSHKVHHYT